MKGGKKNQLTFLNWLDFALSRITAIDGEIKNEAKGRLMLLICEWALNIALKYLSGASAYSVLLH